MVTEGDCSAERGICIGSAEKVKTRRLLRLKASARIALSWSIHTRPDECFDYPRKYACCSLQWAGSFQLGCEVAASVRRASYDKGADAVIGNQQSGSRCGHGGGG